jgi:lysophospholipid acyltransferase (LPLAT)-like uncharacterized protein
MQATQSVLAFVVFFYIRLIYTTSPWEYKNREIFETYINNKKPFIVSFWHGHLLMMACALQWKIPMHMLISNHRDGKIISKAMSYFSINTIAGSTDKKGFEAARLIIQKLKQGDVIGITPDGPRGPREEISEGVLQIARLAKVDIIPLAYSCTPLKRLRTWDKFRVARPFCKGVFVVGTPIPPSKDITTLGATLKQAMDETVSQADEWFK